MNPTDCAILGEKICNALAIEIGKLGFAAARLPPLPHYTELEFTTAKDPYTGLDSLLGIWRNTQGQRMGELKFHADGSFYAEFDVVLPHPANTRWFVEAVTAWGRNDLLRTEAKLLPVLG